MALPNDERDPGAALQWRIETDSSATIQTKSGFFDLTEFQFNRCRTTENGH